MFIRNYKASDFEFVARWWEAAGEPIPPQRCMPPESTFVVEHAGRPVMSIVVLTTNSPEISFLEFFVADPEFRGEERNRAAYELVEYACMHAKVKGFKRVICFAYKEPLVGRYQELGMKKTMTNVTSFAREL